MKTLLFLLLVSSAQATIPKETIDRLKALYPEQTESALVERLENAGSAFQKWRTFPPYYYQLLTRLPSTRSATFTARQGMCAGDAHLENFGFVYIEKPVFTLNDLDDATLCPLNADAMRLFIGHRLVLGSINSAEWLKHYNAGVINAKRTFPDFLKNLEKDSLKKGTSLPKKYKNLLEISGCSGDFSSVSATEYSMLAEYLKKEGKVLHKVCSRTKDTGGSAGQKRFILFTKDEGIELKPLTRPAPLFATPVASAAREEMFKKAVTTFFGNAASTYYFPVNLQGKSYLRRPIWGGNAEIKEDELSAKDLKEVMLHEAYTLGTFHRQSSTKSFYFTNWESTADEVEKAWRKEMGE